VVSGRSLLGAVRAHKHVARAAPSESHAGCRHVAGWAIEPTNPGRSSGVACKVPSKIQR
jgi:hypothetical protein